METKPSMKSSQMVLRNLKLSDLTLAEFLKEWWRKVRKSECMKSLLKQPAPLVPVPSESEAEDEVEDTGEQSDDVIVHEGIPPKPMPF